MPSVLIPFSTGVEEIELFSVVDILRRAKIDVCMASIDKISVVGRSNIKIQADAILKDVYQQNWDMIVLPGGLPNADMLKHDSLVKETTIRLNNDGKFVAAICAAPAALAHFDVLSNKSVTSHPCAQEEIKTTQHGVTYLEQAVVVDDKLITSQGAGTAVEFALVLVAQLTSQQTSDDIRASILA